MNEKVIDIYGKNMFSYHDKERTACRGIVIHNGKILLSYEALTGQWMIPGGKVEEDEMFKECCEREISEETGYLVNAEKCYLRINEYYENWLFISYYYICVKKGITQRNLTMREREVQMEPRWIDFDEAIRIFSTHKEYEETNEERRGLYLRELIALENVKEILQNSTN